VSIATRDRSMPSNRTSTRSMATGALEGSFNCTSPLIEACRTPRKPSWKLRLSFGGDTQSSTVGSAAWAAISCVDACGQLVDTGKERQAKGLGSR
jgi:hypothetical protein